MKKKTIIKIPFNLGGIGRSERSKNYTDLVHRKWDHKIIDLPFLLFNTSSIGERWVRDDPVGPITPPLALKG